jgi:hypothetical protein
MATNVYPKMLTGNAAGTSRAVPLVYPPNHVKQGTYVIFNSATDENAYDGTGIVTSAASNYWENKHHV